jgi:hypothetical protein
MVSDSSGLVINWNKGERAYQIHSFENVEGSKSILISSKIQKDGKIDLFMRGLSTDSALRALVEKKPTKKEFAELIHFLKENLEPSGFVHRFVDLSNCSDPSDALQLLAKSDSRLRVEIKSSFPI